jgi:hypothetical protein
MLEKLKHRSIRVCDSDEHPHAVQDAATLLRAVKGIRSVHIVSPGRLIVGYNVRRITLQVIEALLTEFGFRLQTSLYCRLLRLFCYYIEDIECSDPAHDLAECTRDAFITRYIRRQHGCRDHRPEYLRRYL